MALKKILIDSDICLDSITARHPFSVYADKLLEAVEDRGLTGVVSAESFSNIYYVVRKLSSHQEAIDLLNQLKKIVEIGNINSEIIENALTSGWGDFEDAIQYYCAIEEDCEAIITRNTIDFKAALLPVYTPGEFLNLM